MSVDFTETFYLQIAQRRVDLAAVAKIIKIMAQAKIGDEQTIEHDKSVFLVERTAPQKVLIKKCNAAS